MSKYLVISLVLLSVLSMAPTPYAGVLPQDGDARYELAFWDTIKDSQRAEDYEAYLEAFPNGRFAPLAKARAAYLRKSSEKRAPAPRVPVEEMDVYYEVIRSANVRKEPSGTAQRITTLAKGARVLVTGRVVDKNWYRIEMDKGGAGYVFGTLIRPPASVSDRPKESAPVTREAPVTRTQPEPPPAEPAPAAKPPAPLPAVGSRKAGELRDCLVCPVMVPLPAGSFVMGAKKGDPTERPAHRVSIRKPFAIGKLELSVGEWNACVADGGCRHQPKKAGNVENRPVRDVSWVDAQEYVRWLSKKTGQPYRLPSEAEWEYAARGGTQTKYWWGDRFVKGKGDCKDCGGDWNRKSPTAVDVFGPNPFGLYGMNGGVWEWVSDCWNKSYKGAPTDGSSWGKRDCRAHVIRGGSWRNDRSYMHSASRFRYDADVRYLVNGFRVAKDLR